MSWQREILHVCWPRGGKPAVRSLALPPPRPGSCSSLQRKPRSGVVVVLSGRLRMAASNWHPTTLQEHNTLLEPTEAASTITNTCVRDVGRY